MLRTIASLWMPTRYAFVERATAEASVAVFAEVQKDGSVAAFRLTSDGQGLHDDGRTVGIRLPEPRPEVDGEDFLAGKCNPADDSRWSLWGRHNISLTSPGRPPVTPGARSWTDDSHIADLLSLAFAFASIGRCKVELYRKDGSPIPMDGGHV